MPLTTNFLEKPDTGNERKVNLYEFLDLSHTASQKEINLACQQKVRQISLARNDKISSEKESYLRREFEMVRHAYNVLIDKEKRLAYNGELFPVSADESGQSLPASFFKSIRPAPAKVENGDRKASHSVHKDFFGFSEKPFHLSPNPKYLYLSSKHKEVLAHLVFGLQENNGFLKIIGEVGTGKTMICKSFLKELHANFSIAYITHPSINSLELLQTINAELGLPAESDSRKELINTLNRFLIKERLKGHRVVVIIDEAQDLTAPVLEELRLLSNIETETEKLLQIVLIGQPELDKVLAKPELRQLRQRITVQWELLPLSLEETRGYIQHRIAVAKGKGKVNFTRPAMDLIHKYAQGIPRMINVLADRALLVAFTLNTKKIDKRIVNQAVKDAGLPRGAGWQSGPLPKLVLAGFAVVGVLALALAVYLNIQTPPMSWQNGAIRQLLKNNPADISGAGNLIPKTASASAFVKAPSAGAVRDEGRGDFLRLTQPEKLVAYLAGMSYSESLAESVNWILQSWGAIPKNHSGLNSYLLDSLEKKYGLSVLTINTNMKHLLQLDQPAILEITLPDFQGARYVALTAVRGKTAFLGSMDRIEMPLSALEKLWSRKAIILWKDFEKLPKNFWKGYLGKEVVWLQNNLRSKGFFKGNQARSYGPQTADAVRKFQRQYGIPGNGGFSEESKAMLYSLLNNYPTPKLTAP